MRDIFRRSRRAVVAVAIVAVLAAVGAAANDAAKTASEAIDSIAASSGTTITENDNREWKDVTDPEIIAKYEARIAADQGGIVQEEFQCGGVAVEKKTL